MAEGRLRRRSRPRQFQARMQMIATAAQDRLPLAALLSREVAALQSSEGQERRGAASVPCGCRARPHQERAHSTGRRGT